MLRFLVYLATLIFKAHLKSRGGQMRKITAAAGSAAFAVVAPGFVAGLAPWWLTGWHARQYGAEYQAYLRDVPGWWPRLRLREPK